MVTESRKDESFFLTELQFIASKTEIICCDYRKNLNSEISFKMGQSLHFALCSSFNVASSKDKCTEWRENHMIRPFCCYTLSVK
jgi:hypothetical protein